MATKVLIAHGDTQKLKRAVIDLGARGFDVAATPDGGDAFARFFEEAPELVITSEALPSLGGINFARMVRSQAPDLPVVLLTAEASAADASQPFDVRRDPLDVEELCASYPKLAPARPRTEVVAAIAPSTALVFTTAALKRFQRGNHPLATLDEAGITMMASIAEKQPYGDGEIIIRQGDEGDGFYLVVEGQVRVTLREQNDAEVARIGEGGFFGEMALLSDQPRSASVWAAGSVTLLRFDKRLFMPVLDAYPGLREVLSGVAIERTEENLWSVLLSDDDVQETLAELRDTPDPTPETYEEDRTSPELIPACAEVPRESPAILPPRTYPLKGLGLAALGGLAIGVLMTVLVTRAPKDQSPSAPPPVVTKAETPAPVEETKAEPEPPSEDATMTDVERRELRRKFFELLRANDHTAAVKLGQKLRKAAPGDWETAFGTAEAERQIGQLDEALASFGDFARAFPSNVRADDARFWMAEILTRLGRRDEAKDLLREVLKNPKTRFRASAEEKLRELEPDHEP